MTTSKYIINKYVNEEGKIVFKRYCKECGKEFEATNRNIECKQCYNKKYNLGTNNILYFFIPIEAEDIEIEYPLLYIGETKNLYKRMNKHKNYGSTATQKLLNEYNIENSEFYVVAVDLGTDITDSERKYLESWLIDKVQPIGNTSMKVNHKPKNIERRLELQDFVLNAPLYKVEHHRLTDKIVDFTVNDLVKMVEDFNNINNGVA